MKLNSVIIEVENSCRVAAVFNPASSDNSMISVYPFGDEYYTFTESPVIHRIDPTSLETLHRVIPLDIFPLFTRQIHFIYGFIN